VPGPKLTERTLTGRNGTHNIAVSEGTTGVVQAATTSAYLNGIAGGDPLLILVPRIASVDLHLGPVIEIAVSQIQAFIAKDPEIETLDSP
jgi:hypothetical protein